MDNAKNQDIDLAVIWKKMAEEKFTNSKIEKQNIMDAIKLKSNDDIIQLKKRLGYKILWCLGFIIAFVIMLLFNMDKPDFLKVMSLFTLMYILAGISMYLKYRKMDFGIKENSNILDAMKYNLQSVKSALNIERIWGIFALPLAVPFGLLISKTSKGYSLQECFTDTRLITVALILIVVMVPILMIVTQKMNDHAYGKLIKNMEENIIRMETLG